MYRESEYIFGFLNGMTQHQRDMFWASRKVEKLLSLYLTDAEMQNRKIKLDYYSAIRQVVDEILG